MRAVSLARQLALPYLDYKGPSQGLQPEFLLSQTTRRLELRETHRGYPRPLYVDFVGGPLGFRRHFGQNRRQPIAKAIGRHGHPTIVVDATAGLAQDSFLLACLGFTVISIERSAVLSALVWDGLSRARGHSPQLDEVLSRFAPVMDDARKVLEAMKGAKAPDVVYLDPMYPPRKKDAASKKEMRICRRLVGDDPDAGDLFEVAVGCAKKRVVVKRALHAPPLGPKPDTTHRGTRVRYDVYLIRN